MSRQSKIATGADVIRSRERLTCAWIFSVERPSRVRSRSKSTAIALASDSFTAGVVMTTNRHGWRLCAEGANIAVARIFFITESGTGSVVKRRIERRARKKLCRSIAVKVKVERLDSIDDSSLPLSILPGSVLIFEGELIDVLICTFFCKGNNFTAYSKISFLFVWILNDHRNARMCFHVLIFHASLIGVDENIIA